MSMSAKNIVICTCCHRELEGDDRYEYNDESHEFNDKNKKKNQILSHSSLVLGTQWYSPTSFLIENGPCVERIGN